MPETGKRRKGFRGWRQRRKALRLRRLQDTRPLDEAKQDVTEIRPSGV